MPGRRLSHQERRLLQFWDDPPSELPRPFLESIAITGGLRGIDGLLVSFRYPVSALCGKNGVGKSTILALAALAYNGPSGWRIPNGLYQPKSRHQTKMHYTFGDFFLRSEDDNSFEGVSITWNHKYHDSSLRVELAREGSRWTGYPRRPEREVAFVSVTKVLPAHEVAGIRSSFSESSLGNDFAQLPPQAVEQLCNVMGTHYTLAEIHSTRRYTFQRASAGATYSAFNMGGGESWIICLLDTLYRLPRGSLLVIEEIEVGLHAEALKRLAEVLVGISLIRNIQIVCSTHSEVFLDSMPREARVLVRKGGGEHEALNSPTTRFAVSEMSEQIQPELAIYCEDDSAISLIEAALSHSLRRRCAINAVGNKTTVVRQGVSHLRSGYEMRVLCVLDADCTEAEVNGWISSEVSDRTEFRPECLILPGSDPPETWVLDQLGFEAYRDAFAREFQCTTQEATSILEACRADSDHHRLGFRLGQKTGRTPEQCIVRIMRSVAPEHPQLQNLRDQVERLLD